MVFNTKLAIAGFAIFSIIFGSGNIVFPLIVGKMYPDYYFWASLGWVISAVLITFLGCYVALLYDGDNNKLMKPIGKHMSFVVMLIIMILVGPLGAMARSVNVSCDCIKTVFPSMNSVVFKFVYCLLMTAMAWDPGKLVDLVGRIFTPLKFGGVIGVVVLALYFKDPNIPVSEIHTSASSALCNGLSMGYQTMDMLTAFMIMGTICSYIRNAIKGTNQSDIKSASITVFLIAGTILSIVYVSLIYLASQYSPMLQNTENAALFPKITELALGSSGAWFVAIVISVCCLATNIALTTVFSGYLQNDIFRNKINSKPLILVTGTMAFGSSLIGFDKLCSMMGQVLTYLYPALMVLLMVQWVRYHRRNKA